MQTVLYIFDVEAGRVLPAFLENTMKNNISCLVVTISIAILCTSCSFGNGRGGNSKQIKIDEYKNTYSAVVADIQNIEYDHLNFRKADFLSFPDCEHVDKFMLHTPDISVNESIDVIRKWLSDNGFNVDLEHELYDASGQLGLEDDESYPLVFQHLDELDNGNGFFIDTNECHLQMGGANIYSMSNGVITSFVGSEEKAGLDAMGVYSENIVAEGYVDEMADSSYELMNGPVYIGEAAAKVKEYFEGGTPYLGPVGTEVDVPYVKVFGIGDIYGYEFNVRRVYCGVPFAYGDYGTYRTYNGQQQIDLDIKMAYTITGEVDAYTGYSNNCDLDPIILNQESMMSLLDAMETLDDFIGNQMKIEVRKVALEYCKTWDDVSEISTVFPCWCIEGLNSSDGRIYVFYIDVLDGNILYHSYTEQEYVDRD